jgi:hypothetical protein
LEDYVRTQFPNQTTRFGKLLLRLPALRLLHTVAVEELFFSRLGMGCTVDNLLNEMLLSSIGNPVMGNWFPLQNGNVNGMINMNGITQM